MILFKISLNFGSPHEKIALLFNGCADVVVMYGDVNVVIITIKNMEVIDEDIFSVSIPVMWR